MAEIAITVLPLIRIQFVESPYIVHDKLFKVMQDYSAQQLAAFKEHSKKLIEQAYRKGILDCKDCNQSNEAIKALLIVSQVVAFEIANSSPTPSSGGFFIFIKSKGNYRGLGTREIHLSFCAGREKMIYYQQQLCQPFS